MPFGNDQGVAVADGKPVAEGDAGAVGGEPVAEGDAGAVGGDDSFGG